MHPPNVARSLAAFSLVGLLQASAFAQTIEVQAPPGFAMPPATVDARDDGPHLRGSICSTAGTAVVRPHWIVVTYAGGPGVEETTAYGLPGDPLAGQSAHCAFYDVRLPWRVAKSDRVDVCAEADHGLIPRCAPARLAQNQDGRGQKR